MKKKMEKLSIGALVSLLVIIGLGIVSIGMASAAPSVSIDPQSTTGLSPGDSFSIDVYVDSDTYNLKACKVDLTWNASALTATAVTPGTLLGSPTLTEPGSGIQEPGLIHYGITRTSGNTPVPVAGVFITVDFTVNSSAADGVYVLDLSNEALNNETNAYIPGVVVNDGTATVGAAAPYYDVDLSVDDETKPTTPNVNATYTLTVENTGTIADDYTLSVANPDVADVAALDTYAITILAPSATQVVLLNVADATIGTYRVNVTVVSDNDPTNATDYVNTTTTVDEVCYCVNLTVDKPAQTVYTSKTATYTLTVKNTGNVEDTINVTIVEGIGTLSINPTVTLAADESKDVTLTVQGDTTGTFETTVNATSQGDENETASVTVTTTVEKKVVRRGGGGGAPRDTDGDDYPDIEEMLAGTDPNNPNDYPGAVVATPTPTPTPAVTPTPTPTPIPPVVTPTPTPTPLVEPPVKRPWGLIIGIIIAVVIVGAAAYYFYTKKKA